MTDHDSIPDRDMTYGDALAWLLSRGQSEFGAAMTLLTAWKETRAVIGDGTIQITCTPDRVFRATAPLASLDEHQIPTGLHWTLSGPDGGWVLRWNRETGTVQARRFEHGSSDGFSAEAGSLPEARREALRIAGLIKDGKTSEDLQ